MLLYMKFLITKTTCTCTYCIVGIIGKGKNWRKCTIQLLVKLILVNCMCTVCDTPTCNHYRQVLRRMESEFILESVVRGYHVFQHIWNAVVTEELPCRVETGNPSDCFAVSAQQDANMNLMLSW